MSDQKQQTGLTALSVKNHVTSFVIVGLLCVYGFFGYSSLPKQQDPGFVIRTALVSAALPGASPSRIEKLVTDPIEEVIQEIPELDYIESESQTGRSIIYVNIQEKYKDMRPIFDNLRRKIDDFKSSGKLPDGVIGPMVNDEFGDVFGILYTLTGDGYSMAELKTIADDIQNELLLVDNVAKVEILGSQEEIIYVEYDNARLQKLGMSPNQFSQALKNANILQSGGDILLGQERIKLEPSGSYESMDDIRKTVINLPNGQLVYLEDIASIRRDYVDPIKSKIRYNSQDTLLIAISLKEGGDILALDDNLNKIIPQIQARYPYGIELRNVFSQPTLVKNSVSSFMNNLLQAVAIVAGVMFLFLGFRTGIIVASLIPTTIMVTFVCMGVFEITINQISLAALIIALGLLVDNAIVISEGIMIRREGGEEKVDAAINTGKEMAIPLLISSLTTSAAFLSIFLAESSVGEYTADIFKVVTISLMVSWLLSMTFIPLISIFLMKIKSQDSAQSASAYSGALYKSYRAILFPSLKKKKTTVLIALGLFGISIFGLKYVPNVFIPERTDPIINAEFNMPRGTDIEFNDTILDNIEKYILNRYRATEEKDGVEDVLSFIGVGTPRYILNITPQQEESHTGAMIVNVSNYKVIPDIISGVKEFASTKYPDLEVKMRKLENGTPIDYPIEIRIYGPEIDVLYELVGQVKEKLLSTPGVMDVNDDWGARSKKLEIEIDEDRAKRAGVTNADVALSLQTSLSGLKLTEFRNSEDPVPIVLRSSTADREDLTKLDGISIYSQSSNRFVPLRQVAKTNLEWQNAIIKRRDRVRKITVRAQLFPEVTASEITKVMLPWMNDAQRSWQPAYKFEMGGELETASEANAAIANKIPISGMIILLLLIAQFNSMRKTLIILCTIPLGIIGVTFGLLVGNSIFGFFTVLGIVSLMGIIINNAIVLIDRINIEIEGGLSPDKAITEACQQRLRPILLTTCTTVGGMLPLWVSHDPMFETMAISIIFGLLFATILTLILVPVLYSIFFKVDFQAES